MNALKYVGTFVVGAAIGVASTYFVVKKYYEDIINEEVEEVKAYYKDKYENLDEEVEVEEEPRGGDNEDIVSDQFDATKVYSSIAEAYSSSSAEREHPLDDGEDAEPSWIFEEEFLDDAVEYDKLSWSFYEDDEVIADEKEEMIVDVPYYLGMFNPSWFGAGTNDPDTVYVRNDKLSCDIEVTRVHGSYANIVLGLKELMAEHDKEEENAMEEQHNIR